MESTKRVSGSAVAAGLVAMTLLAAPGTAPAQSKLSVGMPTNPPNSIHTPVVIAQDLGFYKAGGLEVEMLSFEGGVYSFRAMISGDVDIAAASGAFALVARSNGAKSKLIFSSSPKLESVMMAQGDIKTVKDLKGRKIGIQEPGGFAFVLSMTVLGSAGLKKDDVQMVSILSEDVPPLVAGQIDTAILHVDQEIVAKEKKPSLHPLARLADVAPKQLYLAYAVKEDTIAKKRKALVAFTKANIQAVRTIYSDRKKAEPSIRKATGLDAPVVSKALDVLIKNCAWDANSGLPRDMIDYTVERMVKVGNIDKGKATTYDQAVDLSVANEALKELGPWKGPVCAH
jgi:ABC-type nitrate/sulfonate/bicarbonate transport system substrate-binding protein